jgi:hypothetical protein
MLVLAVTYSHIKGAHSYRNDALCLPNLDIEQGAKDDYNSVQEGDGC